MVSNKGSTSAPAQQARGCRVIPCDAVLCHGRNDEAAAEFVPPKSQHQEPSSPARTSTTTTTKPKHHQGHVGLLTSCTEHLL